VRLRSAAPASALLRRPGVRAHRDPEGPRRDSVYVTGLRVKVELVEQWRYYDARPWRHRRRRGLEPDVLRSVQSTAGQFLGLLGGPDNVVDVWASQPRDLILVQVRDVLLISTSSKTSCGSVRDAVKTVQHQVTRLPRGALVQAEVHPGWVRHVTDELGWNVECSRAARRGS
jgi:hypothetical protein